MGIFDPRISFKPFEYDLLPFREAIRMSRWDIEEFDFSEDVQDFHKILNDHERDIITKSMLAISQIEAAAVKDFWGKIGETLNKPEVKIAGYTFAENEITHSLAYSKLLEVLGLNDSFQDLLENPVILDRVNYLGKYLKRGKESDREYFALKLTLFSLFVENVSLFSQFAIIKSFKKHRNYLKTIDSVILATQREEDVHAKFGITLINIMREENPELFHEEFYTKVNKACEKAFKAEVGILNWIFEKGDLEYLKKEVLIEFLKNRFNQSLLSIGGKEVFEVDKILLKDLEWFEEEIYGYVRNDFFNTKSANYNKVKVLYRDIKKSITKLNAE